MREKDDVIEGERRQSQKQRVKHGDRKRGRRETGEGQRGGSQGTDKQAEEDGKGQKLDGALVMNQQPH